MLRKINAWLSLLTTLLLLDHAGFYCAWMLSRGTIPISTEMAPRLLVVLMVVHAVLSLLMAVLGHKGAEKGKYNSYPKLNRGTMLQRFTGLAMLVLLGFHIAGAISHFHPRWLHTVVQPVFFACALSHMAVSVSKALITLGIGNAKAIKVVNVVMAVVCIGLFAAAMAGFCLMLVMGVAK